MSASRVATNWEAKETWERLVSAIIATGVKLDIREIAKYYGTTYDTLENRLRKIKKDAAVLKQEVETGERAEVLSSRTAPNTPKKPRTPKSASRLDSVVNGRVSKGSPSKKSTPGSIKQESFGTDRSFMTDASRFDDDTSFIYNSGASFNLGNDGGENMGMLFH